MAIIEILAIGGASLLMISLLLAVLAALANVDYINFRLIISCFTIGSVCLFIGMIMSFVEPSPPCTTTATRTYSCGKGGTCTETICLDNYKLQRQPSGNPVQVDSGALIESSIKYSGGNQT